MYADCMADKFLFVTTLVATVVMVVAFNKYPMTQKYKQGATANSVSAPIPLMRGKAVSQDPPIASPNRSPETVFDPMPKVTPRKQGQPLPRILI